MSELHEYRAMASRLQVRPALQRALAYPATAFRHRYLVANSFRREFFGRFKGSVLGAGWVLIHPIFLFLTYYMVFGLLFGMRGKQGSPESWYPFYLFSGIITWMLFSESALRSTTVVVDNGNLIKKVAFPAELLPLPLVGVNLLVFGVGLLTLYLAAALWGTLDPAALAVPWPGWHTLLVIPIALEVCLFALGLGLLLATAHVFIRDTVQIFSVVLLFWFFLSPVFWHTELVARSGSQDFFARVSWLIFGNPFYHFTMGVRGAIGISETPVRDAVQGVVKGLPPALLLFFVGAFFFNFHKKRFADEV